MSAIYSIAEEEQNFKHIFENTVRECNRVLKHWSKEGKIADYNERMSIFRGFLAKFFKQKYSWIRYSQDLRHFNPLCSISHNRIINIDLNPDTSRNSYGLTERMIQYLKDFDYFFDEKISSYDKTDIDLSQLNKKSDLTLSQINFKQLENIKF